MTPRWAAKVDDAQPAIITQLEASGFGVRSMARLGGGWPDLLVWRHDCAWLVEVKGDDGRLTDDEARWWHAYTGPGAIVRPRNVGRWVNLARDWAEGDAKEIAALSWIMRLEFVDAELQKEVRHEH